jgi:hypothetical protein
MNRPVNAVKRVLRRRKRADGLIEQVREADRLHGVVTQDVAEEMRKFTEGFAYRPKAQEQP